LSSHRPVGPGLRDEDLRDCIFEKSRADAGPLDVAFLQAEAPPGVVFGAPVIADGMDAENAARGQIVAAHREEAFGSDAGGRLWMRSEWRKATLAATVTGFGPWYSAVGPERAQRLAAAQASVLAETQKRLSGPAILRERLEAWLPWKR
jgi:hypothetical protein